jgi:hypothetical protein
MQEIPQSSAGGQHLRVCNNCIQCYVITKVIVNRVQAGWAAGGIVWLWQY